MATDGLGFMASLSDADVRRFYDFNSSETVKYVGQRDSWKSILAENQGSRRILSEVAAEVDRCERILCALKNTGSRYGAELNRRGLL